MMQEREELQPLDAQQDSNAEGDSDAEQEELDQAETPAGVPFGWIGITLLLNILQYMVFLGLSMVVLIIIRIFMPASMLP